MVFIDANFYELHLISLLDLQANLLQDPINLLVKDCPAVLCWKNEVVQQDCDVMAFVNVLAHPTILRRKRRGTDPLVIRVWIKLTGDLPHQLKVVLQGIRYQLIGGIKLEF